MTLYLFCLATKGIFLLLVYGLRKLVQRGEIEMPSEKTLSAKKERVAQLVEMLKNSAAGVLVDYKGITVEEDTKLRKELREAGVSYFVEKNTILRFALKEAGLDGITNVLEGTTAIAISNDDQTAPARILGKFAEDCKDEKFFLKADTLVRTFTTRQALRLSRRSLQEKLCSHSWLVPFRVLSRSLPQHFRLLWTRTTRLHNLYAA